MNDISDLHPLVQETLRTGKLPSDDEIARAIGETTSNVSRLRASLEAESTDSTGDVSESEASDNEEERFRRKYRQLVDDLIAEWHDDNPYAGNAVPAGERQRIEDYCRSQIQHQWKKHRQRRLGEQET
jgi:hypothetical protein